MNTLIELNITGKNYTCCNRISSTDVKQLIDNYGTRAINKNWIFQPSEAIVYEVVKK